VSVERKIKKRAARRAMRVRNKVKATGHLRMSVFRSLKQIYVQVIDDNAGKTLASCSTLELALQGDKSTRAFAVGKELAGRLVKQGITRVAFDRGDKLFHGRVKALAEGLKEGGVQL
jgi:large subunit ribosomal protein L18